MISMLDHVAPPKGSWRHGKTGYWQLTVNGRKAFAHRQAWEESNGPIPAGLVIDHLCRVRWCCDPDHMEPVTNRENILRGISPAAIHARKTHCPRGHEYSLKGDGKRYCLTCQRERALASGKTQGLPYTADRTHCPQGHEYTPENTGDYRQGPGGKHRARHCKTCQRARAKAYKARKKAEARAA